MYVPNPIRCRKCLRLGHFADVCAKEPVCGFCAKPEHQGSTCETFVPNCVNCKENHHSLDLKCPRYLEEKEIKAIQFREKITYGAARKQYKYNQVNTAAISYAEAARKIRKGVEVGCQTDTYILSGTDLKPANCETVTGITGLPPLQHPSRPITPPLQHPSRPISPPLQHPSRPMSPTLPITLTPIKSPSSPIASGSSDPPPQSVDPGEKQNYFKTPPLPKRNEKKTPRKQNKNKNGQNKIEDKMDTA